MQLPHCIELEKEIILDAKLQLLFSPPYLGIDLEKIFQTTLEDGWLLPINGTRFAVKEKTINVEAHDSVAEKLTGVGGQQRFAQTNFGQQQSRQYPYGLQLSGKHRTAVQVCQQSLQFFTIVGQDFPILAAEQDCPLQRVVPQNAICRAELKCCRRFIKPIILAAEGSETPGIKRIIVGRRSISNTAAQFHDEIKAEVAAVLADRERLAQKQREARHSRLNDPARAEEVEKARAALIFEHGIIPRTNGASGSVKNPPARF